MTIRIVGAGLAGLLAANMLRHHDPVVIEQQPELPNNHSAVLRFRTSSVGDVLGIPFRKVKMIKSWLPWKNPVADGLAYSAKNSGTYRSDRSIVSSSMEVHDRWIAPPDLIQQMADRVDIEFNRVYDTAKDSEKVISTIPMPALMGALEYPGRRGINFQASTSLNISATIDKCDAHVSLMIPDPNIPFSRISITGDELIAEVPKFTDYSGAREPDSFVPAILDSLVTQATDLMGIPLSRVNLVRWSIQRYGKILPVDDVKRRDFIYWASTLQGRAYSLGRFATWRPGLLLDDLIKDVRIIDGWIRSGGSGYSMSVHEAGKRS